MMVASVVPSPLAGPALARPGRTRLLPPCDLPAGSSLQSASGCRIARGGARRPQHISFAAGGGAEGDAFVVEGATNVKFSRELTVPGHKEPLIILGTAHSRLQRQVLRQGIRRSVLCGYLHRTRYRAMEKKGLGFDRPRSIPSRR
uniref:Uncharacterized protein n=1 Tax=Aegilops tauschii subsp. strangulata TaxID=200361 RepID=A0A452XNE3_AEGTS